jgi:sialic acid synthase SpsE
MNRDIFEDLFVLEMTNNHLGKLERGIEIIRQHAKIARFNNVRVAIKLQFRDVDSFVHKDFQARTDIRYINRVNETKLSRGDYKELVECIRRSGCIPMATPFDEESVDRCIEFDLPIIKIASADSNDWQLIEKIARTRKPVIASFGGTPLKDMDDMVTFFEKRDIDLAVNHCVAAYPHEDGECELNQIDFLRDRYPGHIVGWSSHECRDWSYSLAIAYAKGARTFERHIDVDTDGVQVARYSSLPHQIDIWFKTFHKVKEMCGAPGTSRKIPLQKETDYLNSYIRGVYARRDLKAGQLLSEYDIYLAIPLQKGQISTRELMLGEYGHRMLTDCGKDEPIRIDAMDTPYASNDELKALIYQRGL